MPAITLTSPEERFIADIQRCASDVRVSATCNVPHSYPPDGARRWLERTLRSIRNREKEAFIVLLERTFAGIVSLNSIDWKDGSAELDYWVAGDCQGFGVGTEAVRLTVLQARETLGLNILFSSCLASNLASARVLRKNAFREFGRFLNDGAFGSKFVNRQMIRFRKNLRREGAEGADHNISTHIFSLRLPRPRLHISSIPFSHGH